jgi:hypothetical protein
MKKFVFRMGEYIGLLTSLIFAYELIAADRHLPILERSKPRPEIGDFLIENDRELIFIDFSSDSIGLADVYPKNEEFLIELEAGRYLQFDWNEIKTQPLIQATEERAEDQAFYFVGAVFVAIEEGEGDKYIKLIPAPYTDTTASRSTCSKALLGTDSFQYLKQYIFQCML